MERPRIKIEPDLFDKIIEGIGILGLLLLIGLPFFYYTKLPDIIPIHYGLNGKPDQFADNRMIWIIPIVETIIYIGLSIFNRYPDIFNYPKKITEENAERLYRFASKMIRVINTEVVLVFSYLTYAIIQTALGNQIGLGSYFIPFSLFLILGTIGYFVVEMKKKG